MKVKVKGLLNDSRKFVMIIFYNNNNSKISIIALQKFTDLLILNVNMLMFIGVLSKSFQLLWSRPFYLEFWFSIKISTLSRFNIFSKCSSYSIHGYWCGKTTSVKIHPVFVILRPLMNLFVHVSPECRDEKYMRGRTWRTWSKWS